MPSRVTPTLPDTLPRMVWAYLQENIQWVAVTLSVALLIVVIVPPMIGAERKAHETIAQSCAGALQAALATTETTQDLKALLQQEGVHAACAYPALHIIPLPQPSTYAVQNISGKHTYIVTPTSLTRTP
jgi:hypothetical protein